jgi:hypothetical protein
MKQVYTHGLATIIQLSVSSEDSRVRLRAAQWLCAEAEKREKLEGTQAPDHAGEVVAALRGLYAKALGAGPPPLVEPVEAEVAGQPAEEHPEAEVPENLEPEAADSTTAAQFQLERIPGRFGTGQYRRVRVQEP